MPRGLARSVAVAQAQVSHRLAGWPASERARRDVAGDRVVRARRAGAGADNRAVASAAVRSRGSARSGARNRTRARRLPRTSSGGRRHSRSGGANRSAHQSPGGRVALIRRILYVAFFLEVGLLLVVL